MKGQKWWTATLVSAFLIGGSLTVAANDPW